MRAPRLLALACALAAPAAFAFIATVTIHAGVIESGYNDRAVCTVSNTDGASVLVEAMRIKDAAGNVLAFRPATTVAAMATESLQLFGGGQRRCEVDVNEMDAGVVRVRIYNVLSGRSNDGG